MPRPIVVKLLVLVLLFGCTTAEDDIYSGSGTTITVSTFAGDGTAAWKDAVGTAAQFNKPSGIALNSANGLIVIGDTGNHAVRTIAADGTVATLAGATDGSSGTTDATGTAARFTSPEGVAADGSGNVYIADTGNHRIRKVTTAGVVTTFAGSSSGFTDANGIAAKFKSPTGVAIDSNGNVFVADSGNNVIRKIDVAGNVTTVAGDAAGQTAGDVDSVTGTSAKLNTPIALTIIASNALYVNDSGNNKIKKITSGFEVSTHAGTGTAAFLDSTSLSSQFNQPRGIIVDSAGNIIIGDEQNNRIRFITTVGIVQTYAGSGTAGFADGPASSAQFKQPRGIAIDTAGNILVCDYNNNRIRKISRQ